MSEPLTGLDEAVEAAAIVISSGGGGTWKVRTEAGRDAARRLARPYVEAAYPIIAAAVRADERAKVLAATARLDASAPKWAGHKKADVAYRVALCDVADAIRALEPTA